VRKLAQWAAKQDPSALGPIAAASDVPLPAGVLRAATPVMAPVVLATLGVTRDRAKRALDELPAGLDRVDAAIADGVVGGAEPNAADFQVATCVRLATLIDELHPILADRPATALAYRLAPDYPGCFGAPLGLGDRATGNQS
jgi:glutathione S-transferase